jgi:hypothetical protein
VTAERRIFSKSSRPAPNVSVRRQVGLATSLLSQEFTIELERQIFGACSLPHSLYDEFQNGKEKVCFVSFLAKIAVTFLQLMGRLVESRHLYLIRTLITCKSDCL